MPSPLLIALDAAPLGLLSNPTRSGPVAGAWEWASARLADGCRIVVPEIADYEVRRELIRAGRWSSIQRLDLLAYAFEYAPITTSVMMRAASKQSSSRLPTSPTFSAT